jgi:hypothetical protein
MSVLLIPSESSRVLLCPAGRMRAFVVMPLCAQVGMLRCIISLYDHCIKAVTEGAGPGDSHVTWNTIKATMGPIIYRVSKLNFLVCILWPVCTRCTPHSCVPLPLYT